MGKGRLRPPLWPASPGGVSPAARGLWRGINTSIPFWTDDREFLHRESALVFRGTMGSGPLGRAMISPTSGTRASKYTNRFNPRDTGSWSISVTVDKSGATLFLQGMAATNSSVGVDGAWFLDYFGTNIRFAWRSPLASLVQTIEGVVGTNAFNPPPKNLGARSVVVTYDHDRDEGVMYFEGEEINTKSVGGLMFLTNAAELMVGGSREAFESSMVGAYYGFHIWDRAITPAEVALLHRDPFVMYRRVRRTYPTPVRGTATLSATATIAAVALIEKAGTAALSATATIAAVALIEKQGIAALTGVATIAAVATDLNRATAALSATATVAATGTDLNRGTAALSATATIAAVALIEKQGTATLDATATIAAVATDLNRGTAALDATATIAAVATDLNRGAAALTGIATIAAVATDLNRGAAALTGIATIAAVATELIFGRVEAQGDVELPLTFDAEAAMFVGAGISVLRAVDLEGTAEPNISGSSFSKPFVESHVMITPDDEPSQGE